MSAVFRKEIKQLFHSMIGYVYLSAFAAACGYYFLTLCLLPGNGDVRMYASSVFSLMVLLIPMITMRTFSEEKKAKTEMLLIGSPLSVPAIVLGKFLAVFLFFLISLLFPVLHSAYLSYKGAFQPSLFLCNGIGLVTAGAAFVSVGLLISSLTENQVVSCVATYCIILFFWLIGYASGYVANPNLQSVLHALSLSEQFSSFAMGLLDLSAFVYYFGIAITALLLCMLVCGHFREN